MASYHQSPFRGLRRLWHHSIGTKRMTHNGIVLSTDPAFIPKRVRYGVFSGTYEAAEAILVSSSLKPGDKVLEIGAGTGFISLLAAQICGRGNVFSFEANPAMEAIIRSNYALNSVTPELSMKAVTTDGGPITFHSADNLVSSSIIDRELEGKAVSVESVALNSLLNQLKPSVIVIDVEGSEISLMASAELNTVNRIIMELHPHIVGNQAVSGMLQDLRAKGFSETERVDKNVLLTRENSQ